MTRREMIGCGLGAVGYGMLGGCATGKPAQSDSKIVFGVCTPLENAGLLKQVGYDFFENGVATALAPDKDAEWWKRRRDELLGAPVPLRSCNGFIPGKYRLTGPNADPEPALRYAEVAMRRAEEVGVKTLVFGSGGARNVPGDFTGKDKPDLEKGTRQYADFCRELCRRCSDLDTVRIVIEPLRPNESNIINFVWQGLQVVEDVNSPRLAQLADIFHMMMGGEGADSIVKAGERLRHCHIASYGTRLYPGSNPMTVERFVPYFDALKSIGYAGGVSCECGWGEKANFAKNLETALKTMKGLI